MAAGPGTKEYGALTLAVQYYAEVTIAAYVPPNCFMPRPSVDSAVVHLTLRPSPVQAPKAALFKIIHAAFNQRRKTLVNALSAGIETLPKALIAEGLSACDMPQNIRGEALSMADFAALTDVLIKMEPMELI